VYLDEVPFILYYLGEMLMWICSKVPSIPLPKWPYKSEEGWTTLRDWFGDTQDLFHLYICSKFTQFVWKHTEKKSIQLPYHTLKDLFPDDFREDESEDDEWEDEKHFVQLTKELDWECQKQFADLTKKMDYQKIKKQKLSL
jgi:hypothetical protein